MTAKERYYEYLQSDHWASFKATKERIEKRECLACLAATDIDLHHMKYRNPIESAELDDTCWLCRSCHKTFHDKAGMQVDGIIQYHLLRAATVRVILTAEKTVLTSPAKPKRPLTKKQLKAIRMAPSKDDTWVTIQPKTKPVKLIYEWTQVSYAEQEKHKTIKGGFSRQQMAEWGVEWPAKKGWRKLLNQGKNPNI